MHKHNIVHHDLSTANVLSTSRTKFVKIIDFGLAEFCNANGLCSHFPVTLLLNINSVTVFSFLSDNNFHSKEPSVNIPNDPTCSTAFDVYCCACVYIHWVCDKFELVCNNAYSFSAQWLTMCKMMPTV
jgi:serine/threonine protein kinase